MTTATDMLAPFKVITRITERKVHEKPHLRFFRAKVTVRFDRDETVDSRKTLTVESPTYRPEDLDGRTACFALMQHSVGGLLLNLPHEFTP